MAAAGDKFMSLLQIKFLKLFWWDACKFSLAVISVIITYLVATNMHIYHKVGIWHLMQAWARFALQCFSFARVVTYMSPAEALTNGIKMESSDQCSS